MRFILSALLAMFIFPTQVLSLERLQGCPSTASGFEYACLPCYSKDDWYFSFFVVGVGPNLTPVLNVLKRRDANERYWIKENVKQAAYDAVLVCIGEMSPEIFGSKYHLIKVPANYYGAVIPDK